MASPTAVGVPGQAPPTFSWISTEKGSHGGAWWLQTAKSSSGPSATSALARTDPGELLFHDLVLPVTSPENEHRVEAKGGETRLEGFPLLHVDFYRNDPDSPKWAEWLASEKLVRTAPERGIRFQRVAPAVDAVIANAGCALCGIALLRGAIDADGSRCRFRCRAAAVHRMLSRCVFVPKLCSARS